MGLKIVVIGPIGGALRRQLEALDGGSELLEPTLTESTLAELRSVGAAAVILPKEAAPAAEALPEFTAKLETEYTRALRHRHPLSLALLAVDDAESILAAHGADGLEQLVVALADALGRAVRGVDMVLRASRFEIAVLLPDTPVTGARVVAERLRMQASRLLHKPRGGVPLKVTASVGIVDAPREGIRSAAELVRAAREAVSRARALGGDRTEQPAA